jgi:hypothetical protein
MARSLTFPYEFVGDCSIISCSLTNLSDLLALALHLFLLIECPKLWARHDPSLGLRDELGTMVRAILLS